MRRKRPERTPNHHSAFEALETRRLLCALLETAHPAIDALPAVTNSSADGYTPAQIRHAYGFDQLTGDGRGQTIAIVDAYKHPNIVSDLNAFDAKYGIAPPPSFQIVGQSGGSVNGLRVDTGWASEIALDVEWAHAIAPNANILLVETRSDGFGDLMAGVNYARNAAGVSVISMSWGGTEFRGQLKYDATFSTPAGHQGVTFVAASGDDGTRHGAEWPATSSSVIAVGGTTLTANAQGAITGEAAWGDATGGVSRFESKPWFQVGVQNGVRRSTPDVAYGADPNAGFSIYSSIEDAGIVGWQTLAGTSAGTPQWAAAVAIANQLRAAAGLNTLDSVGGTLPALYRAYAAPGTPGYATYTATFNDIAEGHSGRVAAVAGYDDVTGLGSPKAGAIVTDLQYAPSPNITPKTVARPKSRKGSAHPSTSRAKPAARSPESRLRAVEETQVYVPPVFTVAVSSQSSDNARAVESAAKTSSASVADKNYNARKSAAPRIKFTSFADIAQSPLQTVFLPLSLPKPVVSNAIATAENAVDATVQSIDAVMPMAIELGRQEALASFADAVASFAHESSVIGTAVAGSHRRAWAVTFSVLAVDAVLIGYWRMTRKPLRQTRSKSSPFSVCRIGS